MKFEKQIRDKCDYLTDKYLFRGCVLLLLIYIWIINIRHWYHVFCFFLQTEWNEVKYLILGIWRNKPTKITKMLARLLIVNNQTFFPFSFSALATGWEPRVSCVRNDWWHYAFIRNGILRMREGNPLFFLAYIITHIFLNFGPNFWLKLDNNTFRN